MEFDIVDLSDQLLELLQEATDWFEEHLPTPHDELMAKLREEFDEFLGDPHDDGEWADVVFLIFRFYLRQGKDPIAAIRAKFEVNKGREWERAPNGTWHHKKHRALEPGFATRAQVAESVEREAEADHSFGMGDYYIEGAENGVCC